MTKATEGPYRVNKYGSIGAGERGTAPIIATVEPFYGSDKVHGDHVDNAHLLAASWDMRNALLIVAKGLRTGHIEDQTLVTHDELIPLSKIIKDTLAKAEGKEP